MQPGGRGPDAVHVLGARRLEVEVPRAVVAAVLDDVDGPERAAGVAGAEAQVLVVARAGLAVEVDVEELAVPQRLGQAVGVVQRRPSPRARPRGSRPTSSGWSSSLMNASACPIVGSRMSPRGSLGFGSIAKRMS